MVGLSIIIFIFAITASLALNQVNDIKNLAEDTVPLSTNLDFLHKFSSSFESLERDIDKFFLIGYIEYKENAYADLDSMSDNLVELRKSERYAHTDKLDVIEGEIDNLQENLNTLTDLERNMENAPQVNRIRVSSYEGIDIIRSKLDCMFSESNEKVQSNVLLQRDIVVRLNNQITVLSISILAVGVIVTLLLSRSISHPIIQLKESAEQIRKGNLNNEIGIKSKDEVGDLAKAFEDMRRGLKDRNQLLNTILKALKGKVGGVAAIPLRKSIADLSKKNERVLSLLPRSIVTTIKKESKIKKKK